MVDVKAVKLRSRTTTRLNVLRGRRSVDYSTDMVLVSHVSDCEPISVDFSPLRLDSGFLDCSARHSEQGQAGHGQHGDSCAVMIGFDRITCTRFIG